MKTEPVTESGQKTILVVDEDPYNLESLSAWLMDGNYKILPAASAAEACRQSKDYANEIHLLMSNFQMAGMSGVDLATRMRGERPQLKVLLMSGFTEGMLVLNEGWHFLAKPFIPSQLQTLINGLIAPTGQIQGAGVEQIKIRNPSYSQYEGRRELFDKRKGRSL